MIIARSFAMAFNRLVDRRIDATNPRTTGASSPRGESLTVWQVAAFAGASAAAFVASTLLFLPNRLPLYLAVPVLMFLAGYSFAKRFTALLLISRLGTALALSPVAAWIAIRGEELLANPADLMPALVLGGAVLTWVAGFTSFMRVRITMPTGSCRAPQHPGKHSLASQKCASFGCRLPFADRDFCSRFCRWLTRCSDGCTGWAWPRSPGC